MPEWAIILLSVAGGILLLWIALLAVLWVQQRRAGNEVDWREIVRLVPDVVRLIRRLAADPEVPRGTRWWLVGLLGYLLLPIDLVPDFLPVIGFADDAIVVAIVLRFAIRHAGMAAVERHWPGSPAGLRTVLALTRAS
jgi:uncharacterized membrane protein YkvA (DUF1232 family)